MAYTTINKPNTHMNTVLYTGNSSTQAVTGVGFQPDWTWLKARSESASHELFDVVRGVTKTINSNTTNAEATQTDSLTAFDSDGFTLGSNGDLNYNASTYVGWNWLANGTPSSNTDGSITSSVSANTTNGFSIVSYTGTGAVATVGHGLGVAPSMIIFKNRDTTNNWNVYHTSLGNGKFIRLNDTGAEANTGRFNNTSPTSSVFSLGVNGATAVNGNGNSIIAYCFAEKQGYSKFGSYVGNGSTDGTFIYTGFKPAFVLIKKSSGSASWMMYDNARDPDNVAGNYLYANESAAAQTASQGMDFLSNGIKMTNTFGDANESGQTYIYLAFAENPLVGTNNVPATAR